MKNILVIEDDIHINHMLCELLSQSGYLPTPAFSGTEGLLCFRLGKYNLVLLDLMLPGKTGDQVLNEIRKESSIPVISLTAVGNKESVVSLLQMGANDYITKPFDNNELLARIEVQLRNTTVTPAQTLVFRDIVLDLEQFDAFVQKKAVGLSKKEFEILKLMMSHPKKVYTKNNLYESVWNDEFFGDDNTINVHISKIRAKLSAIMPDTDYIQTVWGIGFKMQE